MSKKKLEDAIFENSKLKLENAELKNKLKIVEKRLKSFALDGLQDLYLPRVN